MGGDHDEQASLILPTIGSPPHGRGPLNMLQRRIGRNGLTPAWAGTTPP